ncbi:MAG: serine/threonine-protein kinase [Minicystis sp.]
MAQVVLPPWRLADLLMAAPLVCNAGLVLLEPDGDSSTVSVLRGSLVVTELRIDVDLGNAAAARLSVLAGIDPLLEAGALEAGLNMGRVMVRRGADVAELLVGVSTSLRGIDVQIRLVSFNGRAPDFRDRARLHRCTDCGALQIGAESRCELDGGEVVEVIDSPVPGGTIGVYRVIESLGEGGGGVVLAGEHVILGRPVAIKLLHRNLATRPELARRFLYEARAASRLRHSNVIDITDFGVLEDGRPYMVMERLRGESLGEKLVQWGPVHPVAALLIAREVAIALGAAHDVGIAHNDLKPENIIILEGSTDLVPKLKLIDFGAATVVGTADEAFVGTPGYMAPERIGGEGSDGRADLYSLGMMLYEMIAGAPPFSEVDVRALFLKQLREPVPPLQSPLGVLPQVVRRLVERALSKQPRERQQSAGELLAEIDRALPSLTREGSRRWLP